jgi:hypothetical protein
VSKLERGGFRKATVETLNKIAEALDAYLRLWTALNSFYQNGMWN